MGAEGSDPVLAAARIVRERREAVALTGAGISVESGIPAFRGAQGLWERYDPAEVATIGAFVRDPARVWRMLAEMMELIEGARPNAAHAGLKELEDLGLLRAVVTQNVDGLHQAAGSRRVVEFHGSPAELLCIDCWKRYPSRDRIREGMPPRCACGRILKPNVVLFGEPIPWTAQEEAESEVRSCRVLLVVGTSAEVAPAGDLPLIARRGGATVIEFNPEETRLTRIADLHVPGPAGDTIPRLVASLRGK